MQESAKPVVQENSRTGDLEDVSEHLFIFKKSFIWQFSLLIIHGSSTFEIKASLLNCFVEGL